MVTSAQTFEFHVCSHCTVSYRFWLTLRTLCTWTRTRVFGPTLTLSCSSLDDVVFTLMFVLTVSWFVLLPDSLSYYVLFCTPHSCCHVCHLYFGLVYLFLLVFFTFVVVVEVIEEDVKD